MGIVGLETAFPLLYTYLVKPGVISMERLMELLHDAPLPPLRTSPTGHRLIYRVRPERHAIAIDPDGLPAPWARQRPLQAGRSKAAAC